MPHTETDKASKPRLEWRVHRLKQDPARVAVVAACVAVAGYASSSVFGSPLAGACAALILVMSVADYIFPITYTIDDEGASSHCLVSRREIEWPRVKRVWYSKQGLKLSSLPKPSRLEAFRGVFLEFAGNDDEVIDRVRRMRSGTVASEPEERA